MHKTTQRLRRSIERWVSHCFSRQVLLNVGTLVAVALMLGVYHTWAAPGPTPQPQAVSNVSTGLLSYQGYLTDAGGEPLHGDRDITFRLYSVSTGGTPLWTEAHTDTNAVPVEDGLFNVMLGSLTPIPHDVWSSGVRYLGIQVGDDAEMVPREIIGNVPTALTVPDGSISSSKLGSDVHLLRIESGKEHRTYYDSEWTLHEGEGRREYVAHIAFNTPFEAPPVVSVSLGKLDARTDVGTRITVRASNITEEGFDLVYQTWADSKVNGVVAVWIAYGS